MKLRHLDLSHNSYLRELPESICSLIKLRVLNLCFCRILHGLPEGINRLRNLQHLLIMDTHATRCLPQGLGELSGLHTLLTNLYRESGCNKLGLLKNLNGLSGSLTLEIKITSSSDLEELVEDAREAELRSKTHIHILSIIFKKDEVEQSSSLSWMEVMEALEPNQQKLNELRIWGYGGSALPQWISSPLSRVKDISLFDFDELSSLPPLGKLPLLEFLSVNRMKELKCVGRELLGIESPSSTSTKKVVAFPKLKHLLIMDIPEWSEWEDITAEEEESSLVSILPCFEELFIKSCKGLKKLPHRLLRKASSTLRVLNIKDSPVLQSQYGDKDGSQWRSISHIN